MTPKDTQLNVSTFIDLVKNDLNKEKAKKKKKWKRRTQNPICLKGNKSNIRTYKKKRYYYNQHMLR